MQMSGFVIVRKYLKPLLTRSMNTVILLKLKNSATKKNFKYTPKVYDSYTKFTLRHLETYR
jgi:hypothetical protein